MSDYSNSKYIPWYGKKIKHIEISEGVTSIGSMAFIENFLDGNNYLLSVSIPKSLTSIGFAAFSGCKNLDTFTCYATKVPSAANAFLQTNVYNVTLYVPISSLNQYKSASPWSSFGIIKPIEDDNTSIVDIYGTSNATSIDYISINGNRNTKAHKGINIIKMSDGSVRKIIK